MEVGNGERMTEKELKKLIAQGESETLEFKESLKLLDELGETVSAFSNTKGGIILVGVSDQGKIIGVSIGRNTIEDLVNYIKRHTDSQIFPSVKVERIEGKDTVAIEISEAKEKPIFFKGHAWKRVGKSNLALSASEIRKLAKEKGEKVFWDQQICENATLKDINENKVKSFLRTAKYERRLELNPKIFVKEALHKLELMKDSKLTNAAILLFGKEPQRFFMQSEVRCAIFKGIEPITFIDMKVLGGNIIDQREDAMEFIEKHILLHAKIKGRKRVETWEYPIEAVREAISNAICHRDYEMASNVQIRIFNDRLEVLGCGSLPGGQTVEDLKKTHKSILRNPLIAKCFFLIKYIEEWGTGTNRIIKECLKAGLPEPLFEMITGGLVVTFRKYKITKDILRELNERQRKAIEYMLEHKKITIKEYVKLYPDLSRRTLIRDLNEVIKQKLVLKKGKGKEVFYEVQ